MQAKLHLREPMPLKALGGAEHERRTHAVAPAYVALLDFGRLACLSSRFVHGAADSSTALTCAQQPSCVRNTLSELCRYRLLQTSPSRLTFEPKRVNAPVSHSVYCGLLASTRLAVIKCAKIIIIVADTGKIDLHACMQRSIIMGAIHLRCTTATEVLACAAMLMLQIYPAMSRIISFSQDRLDSVRVENLTPQQEALGKNARRRLLFRIKYVNRRGGGMG